jgi:hypothetical protein
MNQANPKITHVDDIVGTTAGLSAEFGEEMQGVKRCGLPPERLQRIMEILERMAPYGPALQPFIEEYINKDPGLRAYKALRNMQIPLEK